MDFAAMLREAREEEARKQTAKKNQSLSSSDSSSASSTTGKPSISTEDLESKMKSYCALDLFLHSTPPLSPSAFDSHKVSGELSSAYLFQNWISEDEEKRMLDLIYSAPTNAWVTLKTRRLQNWGGIVKENMQKEPLPLWLDRISEKLVSSGLFPSTTTTTTVRPNHVLINEYKKGQGILPHTDGPRYFPRVATLSLGSDGVMEFHKTHADTKIPNGHVLSIFLPRRSLLIFTDQLYSDYLHSIPAREIDHWEEKMVLQPPLDEACGKQMGWARDTRVSLTIRIV